MRLEHSVVIRRPAGAVFAFLADPSNLPLWQSGLVEVRPGSEEPGLGARHVEVRNVFGQRIVQTLEVTAYEPDERLDLTVVEGPLALTVRHHLTAEDGATRIDVVGEGDPGPLFRFVEPFLVRTVERQSRSDFARLTQLLEDG